MAYILPHRWDTRNSSDFEPSQAVVAHEKEILAVAFSPSSETMLLTGSSDKVRTFLCIREDSKCIRVLDNRTLGHESSQSPPT